MDRITRMLFLQDRTRPHQFLTAVLWTVSVVAVLVSTGIAMLTGLMAMSLGWSDAVTAGAEPWLAALAALGETAGVATVAIIGMVLWHTRRFKIPALILVAAAAIATLWLGTRFVSEYT